MIATEYQPLARRTMKEMPREDHFVHMALGLCGEMGEFIDAVKKHFIYGKPLDLVNLTEEAGDDFWYAAGLLPELGVPPVVLQRAIDEGYAQGTKRRQEAEFVGMQPAKDLLALNMAIASVCCVISNEPSRFSESSSEAVKVVETVGGILGTLCGLFNLDPALAMDLNIKKLAKRYGDKYSDVAALNRDLEGERAVLEGKDLLRETAGLAVITAVEAGASAAEVGAVVLGEPVAKPEHPLGANVLAEDAAGYGHAKVHEDVHGMTFEQLVEHGRQSGCSLNGDKQMPWSFSVAGVAVTHENDECYIICGQGAKPYIEDNGHFTPGDKLSIVGGVWSIERPATAEKLISPNTLVPPPAPMSLDSDTPLAGGSCSTDGPCESCQ